MKNIVIFGPPGAGKGTQAEKIIADFKLIHISTGDILRNEVKNNTELGQKAKKMMHKGHLVSDEIVIGMIKNKIQKDINNNGFIFDGFPRTINQAANLDALMNEINIKIDAMISLEVNDKELIKRLLLRGQNSGRKDDQNQNIIENRIKEYSQKTLPIKAYYKKQNKLNIVNGIGSISDIFKKINLIIQNL